jgi:hypothetical protein
MHDAPGGTVEINTSPGSGRVGRQPTSTTVQIAIAIEMCRILTQTSWEHRQQAAPPPPREQALLLLNRDQ